MVTFARLASMAEKRSAAACSGRLRLTLSSSPAICSDFLLHPWQTRERGWPRPAAPVSASHSPASRERRGQCCQGDRRQQRRLPVGEQAKRFGLAAGGASVGQTSTARSAATRTWLKITSWAAGGPHPGVIPARHHADARAVAVHQPCPPAAGYHRFRPTPRQPAQPFNAGGINLAAADVPALRATGRHGVR